MSPKKIWSRRKFLAVAVPAVAAAACGPSPAGGLFGGPDGGADAGPDTFDGGGDAGLDGGPADAGLADAGLGDAGPADAGSEDAGPGDAGPQDAGPADAGQSDTHVCASNFPRLDIKADCGAVGDGQTNDTAAFQNAAAQFNAAGGGELVIPPGIYKVGKQTVKANPSDSGPWYVTSEVFVVQGLSCLKISGYGATLKVKAGLHYGGFNPSTGQPQDYSGGGKSNEAAVGRVLGMTRCSNVLIEGVEIDGSNESLILGGQWGNADRQAAATGLYFNECEDVTVVDVHTHHNALDGIAVEYQNGPPPRRMLHTLTRVNSEYNGRQGISWIGGWGLTCIDCKFNHTGRALLNGGAPMTSKPGDGLDIEPNAGTTQKSREGVFTRCEFINNVGNGIEAANGDGGYSTFDDCTIWGVTRWSYSIWANKPGMKFTNCRIYGTLVTGSNGHGVGSTTPNAALATQFEDCTFEDKNWTNGQVFRSGALVYLTNGVEGMSWKRCTFVTHQIKAVDIGNTATTEIFDSCTFVHGYTGLSSGSAQSSFTGCKLKSCHFEESAQLSSGSKTYAIAVTSVQVAAPAAGGAPTHVDGPKVKWNSATSGQTGDIAPGTYS